MDDDGSLKNAAILLFGKKPQKFFPSAQFKIGRFGRDEADLMFQDVIEGNIIQMADRVMDILQAKYLVSPVRFEGMQRYEKLEIPKEAMREILYNAIAHKDYTGPDIQMHVYDDHLEIWNEGELPMGYSQETLYGNHSSKPRNLNIANAFFKAGFIDAWGRGYKKIREGFEGAGLPMPKIESAFGGVMVTFQRNNVNTASRRQEDDSNADVNAVAEELTERQKDILEILRDVAVNVAVNTKYLSERMHVNRKTIQRDIVGLQEHRLVQWVGSDKTGHWEIVEDNNHQ